MKQQIIKVCNAIIDRPFAFEDDTIFCIHCKAIQGKTKKEHFDNCPVNDAKYILQESDNMLEYERT